MNVNKYKKISNNIKQICWKGLKKMYNVLAAKFMDMKFLS